MAVRYLKVILGFTPAFLLNNVALAFVRNAGAPRLAMAAMVTGSLLNVVLDWVFIYPMQWGMFGAALATGIAAVVSLGMTAGCVWRRVMRGQRWLSGLDSLPGLCLLGLPSMMTELASGLVMLVFNGCMLKLAGTAGVAAYGMVANVMLVMASLLTGIAQGTQPLISQAWGQGDRWTARRVLGWGLATAVVLAVVLETALTVWAEPVVAVFNASQQPVLTVMGRDGLRLYGLGFVPMAVSIAAAGGLSAAGFAGEGLAVTLLRGGVLAAPAVVLMSLSGSLTALWLAVPTAEWLTAVAALAWLICRFRGDFKGHGSANH